MSGFAKWLTRRDVNVRRIPWLTEQLLASEQSLRCMLAIVIRQTEFEGEMVKVKLQYWPLYSTCINIVADLIRGLDSRPPHVAMV